MVPFSSPVPYAAATADALATPSGRERMPHGRERAPRGLAALVAALAMLGASGCDAPSNPNDYVRIQVAGSDAGPPHYDEDAAADGAMNTVAADGGGSDAATFDDGGNPAADAGTLAADSGAGGSDASAGFDATCMPEDCGNAPADVPVCFDGQPAQVICQRWVDRSCRWQLVCGM